LSELRGQRPRRHQVATRRAANSAACESSSAGAASAHQVCECVWCCVCMSRGRQGCCVHPPPCVKKGGENRECPAVLPNPRRRRECLSLAEVCCCAATGRSSEGFFVWNEANQPGKRKHHNSDNNTSSESQLPGLESTKLGPYQLDFRSFRLTKLVAAKAVLTFVEKELVKEELSRPSIDLY